jgi:hypothetical protein
MALHIGRILAALLYVSSSHFLRPEAFARYMSDVLV